MFEFGQNNIEFPCDESAPQRETARLRRRKASKERKRFIDERLFTGDKHRPALTKTSRKLLVGAVGIEHDPLFLSPAI
jgi:hypothetical protein